MIRFDKLMGSNKYLINYYLKYIYLLFDIKNNIIYQYKLAHKLFINSNIFVNIFKFSQQTHPR